MFMASLPQIFLVFSIAALSLSILGRIIQKVPAIFVFGDSLADVGNNNNFNSSRIIFPHNGIEFLGGIPKGRFSNGYNNIDWIANHVGYKQSPPAYISITEGSQLLRGVNFASGGSRIMDTTGEVISFSAQLTNFKNVINLLEKELGKGNAADLIKESLFLISAGSNDMFAYYVATGAQNEKLNKLFIAALLEKFAEEIKVLYTHGAMKLGILGISHIGCTPAMKNANPLGTCMEALNSLARDFSSAAKAKMHLLKSELQGMNYSYGNIYHLMSIALKNPELFGSEMDASFVPLGNLSLDSNNSKIQVRVARKWESINTKNNEVFGINMQLVDIHGTEMQARVGPKFLPLFQDKINEGSIYEINDFNVVEVNDDYLTVHKDIQIHFHACTYIVESTDQGLRIPNYKFSFTSYEEIAKRINDKKYLTDIFGMLKHVGDVQDVYKRNGDTTIKRELWVELSCGNKIAITLWGDKTELVEPHQVKPNSTTVIFSSGLVKEFDRKPTLSATSATKLYLDMDIEETRRLMKSNSKRKYDAEDEEFFTTQKYNVIVHHTAGVVNGGRTEKK